MDHVRHAIDAVTDETRENAPFALRPMREVAVVRFEEALGVAPALAGRGGLAKHLDMVAGHHFQATTTEYTIDLLRRHRCAIQLKPSRALR